MSAIAKAWETIKHGLVYAALIAGSVVFSLPFVWMATTSVKTDTELFQPRLTLLPTAPRPRLRSPYIDTTYYRDLDGPYQKEVIDFIISLIPKTGFRFPAQIDQSLALDQTARGVYQRMRAVLSPAVWSGSLENLLRAVRARMDKQLVDTAFARIYRRLTLGQIRLRTTDLSEAVLDITDFKVESPDSVRISPYPKHRQWTLVAYDFSRSDRWSLSKMVDVKFDPDRLHRVQLDFQADDTWHELTLSVEKSGIRYVSDNPIPLAGFTWTTFTWQPPSQDDQSTKIKTWNILKPVGESPLTRGHPHRMKIAIELKRVTPFGAWISKLQRNYDRVLRYMPFWRYVRVSLFLVVANMILTLFSSSLVAYAFARLQWPGRNFCFLLMLATLMIPPQVTMIPNFLIWRFLGAYDTLFPLWIPSLFGVPFYIFLLRQFMMGIPKDLEDAARIDGCGFLRIYWYIMLPLVRPSLIAIAVFTFMSSWNDFIGPLIYIADQRLYPLAFGLFAFSIEAGNNPALTMAASLLMTLPVIVIFFFTQRYFIQGITMSGIKG